MHYTYSDKEPTPPSSWSNLRKKDLQRQGVKLEAPVDLFQILDKFLSLGYRKVFLTSHFNSPLSEIQRDYFLSALSKHFDKILFLSQVSQKELFQIQESEKVLFFNDQIGYTSVLHSLADVAFILGPINMLEGIFLGAKLIFMNKSQSSLQSEKYRPAFEQLKQTALGTNRAVYIEDLKEVEKALSTLDQLASKALVFPDEVVVEPKKGSALDQLMDRLYFQITESALSSQTNSENNFSENNF